MYARMQERLLRMPGVVNAAFSLYAPMSGDNWWTYVVAGRGHLRTLERLLESRQPPVLRNGRDPARPGQGVRPARPCWFAARRVVSQSLAQRLFGDADP